MGGATIYNAGIGIIGVDFLLTLPHTTREAGVRVLTALLCTDGHSIVVTVACQWLMIVVGSWHQTCQPIVAINSFGYCFVLRYYN